MYDPRNIFKQEPNAIREAILAILAVLVMTDVVDISEEATAGIGLCVSLVLGLFYVRPLTASKDALQSLSVKPSKKAS